MLRQKRKQREAALAELDAADSASSVLLHNCLACRSAFNNSSALDRHLARNTACQVAEDERVNRQAEMGRQLKRARRDDVIKRANEEAAAAAALRASFGHAGDADEGSHGHAQGDESDFNLDPAPKVVNEQYVRVSHMSTPVQTELLTAMQTRTRLGRRNIVPARFRQAIPSQEGSEPTPSTAAPAIEQAESGTRAALLSEHRYRTQVDSFGRYRIYNRLPDQPKETTSNEEEQESLKRKAVSPVVLFRDEPGLLTVTIASRSSIFSTRRLEALTSRPSQTSQRSSCIIGTAIPAAINP